MKHSLAHSVELDLQADASRTGAETLVRQHFFEEADVKRRVAIRRGLWVAVLIYLLFSVTDVLLVPDVSVHTTFARFVVGIAALLILETQVRVETRTDLMDITCAAALVCGYLGWLLPAMTTAYTINMSYYMVFGAIFMMGANLFFTFNFALSLFASSVVLVIFFVALSFLHKDIYYQIAFGTFYLACFSFTSYVNWRLNRERARVFLSTVEAKVRQREADDRGEPCSGFPIPTR